MTHVELFRLLEAGQKIRRTNWPVGHWIELKDDIIVDERGYTESLYSGTYRIYDTFEASIRGSDNWNELKLEVIANKAWKNGQLTELAEAKEPDRSLIEESFLKKKGLV